MVVAMYTQLSLTSQTWPRGENLVSITRGLPSAYTDASEAYYTLVSSRVIAALATFQPCQNRIGISEAER